ncbi:MAG TPA: cupredoxin domain-containing protein [Candidatus Binatia bacterium]|nr:cupredoxin domain-containing protein [Candidatus Binatia bacterium]
MRRLGVVMGLALVLSAGAGWAKAHKTAAPAAANFTLVNLEYEGTKIWLPGEITVKKGTKVTLKLINNAPSGEHGFSIPAFNVAEVVQKGEPKTVEFTADKVGIFPFLCQLHPAHVGGQIVVLP